MHTELNTFHLLTWCGMIYSSSDIVGTREHFRLKFTLIKCIHKQLKPAMLLCCQLHAKLAETILFVFSIACVG